MDVQHVLIADLPHMGQTGTLMVRLAHDRQFEMTGVGVDMRDAIETALIASAFDGARIGSIDGSSTTIGPGTFICSTWSPSKE